MGATRRWPSGRAGRPWRHRSPVADYRDEPHDHPARPAGAGRQRSDPVRPGATTGWRSKAARKKRPDLTQRMDEVMEGETAGDPTSAVKWSRKSTRTLSRVLRISHTKAWRMLRRA